MGGEYVNPLLSSHPCTHTHTHTHSQHTHTHTHTLTGLVSDGEKRRRLTEHAAPDIIHGTHSEHIGHAPLQVLDNVSRASDVIGHLMPGLGGQVGTAQLEEVVCDWTVAVARRQPGDEGGVVVAAEDDPVDLCGLARRFCWGED